LLVGFFVCKQYIGAVDYVPAGHFKGEDLVGGNLIPCKMAGYFRTDIDIC